MPGHSVERLGGIMTIHSCVDDKLVVEILKQEGIFQKYMQKIWKRQRKQKCGFIGTLYHGKTASYQFRYYWGYPDPIDNGWVAIWVENADPGYLEGVLSIGVHLLKEPDLEQI